MATSTKCEGAESAGAVDVPNAWGGPYVVKETYVNSRYGNGSLRYIVVGRGHNAIRTRATIRRGAQLKYWKSRDAAQSVADDYNTRAKVSP